MIKVPDEITEEFIRKHLKKGDVLFWEYYEFKNKNKKTSRFVILTECQNDTFLAIRTTKRIELYQQSSNLNREFIILSSNEDPLFPKPTVLDLNRIHVLKIEKMKKFFGEQIKRPDCLSENIFEKLEKLVAKSKILRKDWKKWILNSKKSKL